MVDMDEQGRDDTSWLYGGGTMGALIAAYDWSRHPIGPLPRWPAALRVATNICLNSRFPMIIWWGPGYHVIYNDAYAPTLGTKHPTALGQRGDAVWPEIWDVIGHMLHDVRSCGQSTWSEDAQLFLERAGYREETYHTWSYSPIVAADGTVGGVFTAVTETTQRVLAQRRLHTLRDIASRSARTRSVDEACAAAGVAMEERDDDIPCAAVYLCEPGALRTLRRRHLIRFSPDAAAVPETIDIDHTPWPVLQALQSGLAVVPAAGALAKLPGGACQTAAPALAVAVRLDAGEGDGAAGVLLMGINPARAFDDDYRGFVELVASHIATASRRARAYQEEKSRAENLAALDRAKTVFFSNVSHEFRTPLTLMLAPIEALLNDAGELTPAQREHLHILSRNAQRLLKLVNTLLDFSRIEAGRLKATFQPTDIVGLTTDLASAFRSTIERAHMRLQVEADALPQPVYVDHDMWEKIILNLLSNAFKYTFAGAITVRITGDHRHAQVQVCDTGVGIPASELPRLFERFHRVEGLRGRSHEGTGIGLALVHELVKLHGGTVGVISTPGEGSTFTVTLPFGYAHLPAAQVRQEPAPTGSTASIDPYVEEASRWLPVLPDAVPNDPAGTMSLSTLRVDSPQRNRLLIADDNADIRDYLRRLLTPRYDVTTVADGASALRACRQSPPDLVISDVMMPGMDGAALLRALRGDERLGCVPVILLSARAGEEARIEGMEAGADDYIVKPFAARELLARIAAHLDMARLRREAGRERERLLARERQAVRHRDEFLGIASHELRTPITSLRLQLQLTERDIMRFGSVKDVPDARLHKMMHIFSRQLASLSGLVDDLLDVSRIANGRLTIEPRVIDLARLTQDMVEQNREQLESAGCTVWFDAPKPVMGCWDPKRIEQVIVNLLSNAAKYAPGTRVEVRVERQGHIARLSVKDHGSGIHPDQQGKVFERFERAVSCRHTSGLGLGLFIIKEIISAHKGQIELRSAVNAGAEFIVTLPVNSLVTGRVVPDGAAEHLAVH